MAVQPINTLQSWFQTQDKPTQDQFWDWLDSYYHKNYKIQYTDLHVDLQNLLISLGTTSSVRPEERAITTDTSIIVLAKFKFVGISVYNPSSSDLVFHLNYPGLSLPGGEPWQLIEVPAGGNFDLTINKTFWTTTAISMNEVTGVDFSETPVILLIDRK
jgi:hypothetical protein